MRALLLLSIFIITSHATHLIPWLPRPQIWYCGSSHLSRFSRPQSNPVCTDYFHWEKKGFPSFFITFLTRTFKYHHFPAFAWRTLSLCALGVALHSSEMNLLTSWSFFKTSADLCSIKDLLYASIASLSFSCLE